MTKQIKAIQAALTALKSIDAAMPFPVAKFAIHHLEEALAEALAEQPARPYRLLQDNGSKYFGDSWDKAEQPAQQALDKMAENARELGLDYEHPTQYWRAYASDYERGVIDGMQKQMQSSVDRAVNAMAEQPAQQEPVATVIGKFLTRKDELRTCIEPELPLGTKLYTSPPAQRTWVGLTDEEITDIWAEASPYYHEDDFARAIEAKLREKNNG